MQNKINLLAITAFLLASCATECPVSVRYEKQSIPQDLLECPTNPECTATMQSDIARCLLEYDAALEQCRGRLTSIKEVVK